MSSFEPIYVDFEYLHELADRVLREAAEIPTQAAPSQIVRGTSLGPTKNFHEILGWSADAALRWALKLSEDLNRVSEAVRITAEEAADRDNSIASSVNLIVGAVDAVDSTSQTGIGSGAAHAAPPPHGTLE